jgi:transglutaminase-like putative cysteine protease
MLYKITHRTDYRYTEPASEAYIETRLTPQPAPGLEILRHAIVFNPDNPVSEYRDYFGNRTNFYSMTLRHERLSIVNELTVRTCRVAPPQVALKLTVAEARQIISSHLSDVFDYLQATAVVPVGGAARHWGTRFFRGDAILVHALEKLNRSIHRHFAYQPGATNNQTSLATVWKQRRGVCQDFAHVMLSVLRTCGLPARYVCGYIDPSPLDQSGGGTGLVGAAFTHAWVEILMPGGDWVAMDPTNNCWCHEQHVPVARGRDFRDAAPVIGTFKTAGSQKMKARVLVRRLTE